MDCKTYSYDEVYNNTLEYFNGNELAASIWISKYALRNNDNELVELTPRDMHHRLAKEFHRIEEKKFKNPLSYDEIFFYLDKFKKIIPQGSPAYGIGNTYKNISLSNCFVLESPEDSYGGILDTDEQLVQISKRRGGVGIDISNLRPSVMPTRNAARMSTGVTTFMERYSNSIREVGQDGRRGALMLTISVHHPEVLEFAKIKNDSKKVTGANISVRLTDEFLLAVDNDTLYEQRFPVDSKNPTFTRMVRAREVWDALIHNAWLRAEPGLLFWDRIILYSPADCYADFGFRTISTNPSLRSSTLVYTNHGWFPIKEIFENSDDKQVFNINGEWKSFVITQTGTNEQLVKITFSNNKEIYCTKEHKWVIYDLDYNFKKIETKNLQSGYCIPGAFGNPDDNVYQILGIRSIEYTDLYEDVYDITVLDDTNTFLCEVGQTGNCGELPLCFGDSCRLLVQNLIAYVKNAFQDGSYFDYDEFYKDSQIAQRFMDNIVDLELESIQGIIDKVKSDPEPDRIKQKEIYIWSYLYRKCQEGRRTGLGVTAVGDTLAALGLKYDSDAGIDAVEKIYKTLKLGSYRASVDMAKELGPFPIWDWELEKNNLFIQQIGVDDPQLLEDIRKYGRRNIANLTTAPVGSMSNLAWGGTLVDDNDVFGTTSGIEPIFRDNPYKRRKKINPNDEKTRVDFVDELGDRWQEYDVYHNPIRVWMSVNNESNYTKSPYHDSTSDKLDWKQRVKLQAAAQKHVDHSISSTINLPENATEEQVADIYLAAWKSGCKGVTVYRDKCRSGVLIENNNLGNKVRKTDAPKRPKSLPCDIHEIKIKGKPHSVLVGLYNNDPYEVMVICEHLEGAPKSGKIVKVKRGHYKLLAQNDDVLHGNITDTCSDTEDALTRMLSTSLRHGADISFIVTQLSKTKGDLQSMTKSISRALKNYIPDGKKLSGENCPECSNELIFTEGCMKCNGCGFSKCG